MYKLREKCIRICDVNKEYKNTIMINKTDVIVKLLEVYGKWITNLAYELNAQNDSGKDRIEQAIKNHCAKTLVKLELLATGNSFITGDSVVFIKVTHLKLFRVKFENNLQLKNIYPALIDLYVSTLNPIVSLTSLAQSHQNLRSVIYLEPPNGKRAFSNIGGLLDRNLRLDTLHLIKYLSENAINWIANHEPELKEWRVTCYDDDGFTAMAAKGSYVKFDTIKRFIFDDQSEIVEKRDSKYSNFPIKFESPQRFDIWTETSLEHVAKMVKLYKSLLYLSIPLTKFTGSYSDNHLFTLLDALPILKELTLQWSKASVDATRELLRRIRQKVTFITIADDDKQALSKLMQLEELWKLESIDTTYIKEVGTFFTYARKSLCVGM